MSDRQRIANLMSEARTLRGQVAAAAIRLEELGVERAGLVTALQSSCAHPACMEFRLTISHRGRSLDSPIRVCLDCRFIESAGSLGRAGFEKLTNVVRTRGTPLSVDTYRDLQERLFEEGALDER